MLGGGHVQYREFSAEDVHSSVPVFNPALDGNDVVFGQCVLHELVGGGEEEDFDAGITVREVHDGPGVALFGHLELDAGDQSGELHIPGGAAGGEQFGDGAVPCAGEDVLCAVQRVG